MQNKCRTVDIGGLSLSKVLWPPGSHISSPPLAPVGWTQMAKWQGLWKKIVCVCVRKLCLCWPETGRTYGKCHWWFGRCIRLWRGSPSQNCQLQLVAGWALLSEVHAIIINDLAPTSSMLYDVACTSCSPVAGSQMPFFVTYFAVKGLPGLRNTWWGTLGKKLRWRTGDDGSVTAKFFGISMFEKILRCCCWTKIRRIKIKRGWMKYVWTNIYIYKIELIEPYNQNWLEPFRYVQFWSKSW